MPRGEQVGYGVRAAMSRDAVIATLAIGWADGYPQQAQGVADALVRGRRAPILAISANSTMLDVSGTRDVAIDDETRRERLIVPLEKQDLARPARGRSVAQRQDGLVATADGKVRQNEILRDRRRGVRRFIEAARSFIRMLVSHIETEDSLLFRIGNEVLDDEDKAELMEAFKKFNGEIGVRPVAEHAQALEVGAVALGRLKRQAVAPYQLRQLQGGHRRSRNQAHEIALTQRRRDLQREENQQESTHGRGHPERSNRLSTASTEAYNA